MFSEPLYQLDDLFPSLDDISLLSYLPLRSEISSGSLQRAAVQSEWLEFSAKLVFYEQNAVLQKYVESILLWLCKYDKHFPKSFKIRELKEGISMLASKEHLLDFLNEAVIPHCICYLKDKEHLSEVFSSIKNCRLTGAEAELKEEFFEGDTSSNATWVKMPSKDSEKTFLALPADEDALVMSDLHGDIDGAIYLLVTEGFNSDGTMRRIIVLGDMIDRGVFGLGVLYFFVVLRHIYPDKVFLLAGNHEEHLAKVLEALAKGASAEKIAWLQKFVSAPDAEVIRALQEQPADLQEIAEAIRKLPLALFTPDGTMYAHGNLAWPYDMESKGDFVQPTVGTFVFSHTKEKSYHILWSEFAMYGTQPGTNSRGGSGPGFYNGEEVYVKAFQSGIERMLFGHTHTSYVLGIEVSPHSYFQIISLVSSWRASKNNHSSCAVVGVNREITLHHAASSTNTWKDIVFPSGNSSVLPGCLSSASSSLFSQTKPSSSSSSSTTTVSPGPF